MAHHRFIKLTLEVTLTDPTPEPGTSGPPDDEVINDFTKSIQKLMPKKGNKEHPVKSAVVTKRASSPTP